MPAYSKEVNRWYHRKIWYQLRAMVLAQSPICQMCLLNGDTPPKPSTVADHKRPHNGVWSAFCDLENLWGLCKRHHDEKTATENCGFGNASRKYVPQRKIEVTGDGGTQFISGTIPQHQLDRALGTAEDIAELLKDIPQ
jgi:hypothetical protein